MSNTLTIPQMIARNNREVRWRRIGQRARRLIYLTLAAGSFAIATLMLVLSLDAGAALAVMP